MTTQVRITQRGLVLAPDISSVHVVQGDSVEFFADPDTDTNLCMTADAAALFSPQASETETIEAGNSRTFTFGSAGTGDYCILTQPSDWPYPDQFDCGSNPGALSIKPGPPPNYSGPDTETQT
jgi:hypothetical protein